MLHTTAKRRLFALITRCCCLNIVRDAQRAVEGQSFFFIRLHARFFSSVLLVVPCVLMYRFLLVGQHPFIKNAPRRHCERGETCLHVKKQAAAKKITPRRVFDDKSCRQSTEGSEKKTVLLLKFFFRFRLISTE